MATVLAAAEAVTSHVPDVHEPIRAPFAQLALLVWAVLPLFVPINSNWNVIVTATLAVYIGCCRSVKSSDAPPTEGAMTTAVSPTLQPRPAALLCRPTPQSTPTHSLASVRTGRLPPGCSQISAHRERRAAGAVRRLQTIRPRLDQPSPDRLFCGAHARPPTACRLANSNMARPPDRNHNTVASSVATR